MSNGNPHTLYMTQDFHLTYTSKKNVDTFQQKIVTRMFTAALFRIAKNCKPKTEWINYDILSQ